MSEKIRKIISLTIVAAIVVATLCCSSVVWGDQNSEQASTIDSALFCQDLTRGDKSIQELLDGTLADKAGIGAEYMVLAIRQHLQSCNFDRYCEELKKYSQENPNLPASTQQKIALLLLACGGMIPEQAAQVARDTAGNQGIMSWIFGLHLATNTAEGALADSCLQQILNQQGTDGGWGVDASAPTVDVTAMAIQALTPYRGEEEVDEAIFRAVEFLKQAQLPSGGFMSYGVENCESLAQVIIALSGLDVDMTSEFVVEGKTLLQQLEVYKLPSGGFGHTVDSAATLSTTAQAVMALVALDRSQSQLGPMYVLDSYDFGPGSGDLDSGKDDGSRPSGTPAPAMTIKGIQIAVGTAILLGGVGFVAFRTYRRRMGPVDAVAVLLVALALAGFVTFSEIETKEQYYSYNLPPITDQYETVTLTIVGTDGVILETQTYALLEGDTVFDLLYRSTRAQGIALDYTSGLEAYVSGISGLYSGEHGGTSGWMYSVDGETPNISCSSYVLSPGEAVVFYYSMTYQGGAQ